MHCRHTTVCRTPEVSGGTKDFMKPKHHGQPESGATVRSSKLVRRLRPGIGWCMWHSADQPPDDDMTVLIALSDGEVWTGFMDAGDWRFVCGELVDQGEGTKVTHWAEFPDPPNDGTQRQQPGCAGDGTETL